MGGSLQDVGGALRDMGVSFGCWRGSGIWGSLWGMGGCGIGGLYGVGQGLWDVGVFVGWARGSGLRGSGTTSVPH